MHPSTYGYLMPTAEQKEQIVEARAAAAVYADVLDKILPEGPDKTFIIRSLRTVAMWVNVNITRNADGSPRS